MKPLFLSCILALAATVGLQASPVPACDTLANETFAGLLAAGSCSIGDKVYDNFTFLNSAIGGVPVTASAVGYTVINTGNAANGFDFGVALTAGAGATNDIHIGYDVTSLLGPTITSADLTITGLAIPPGSGATASFAETVCPGHDIAGCLSAQSLTAFIIAGGPSQLSDHASFAGVTELGVSKDINVFGGATGFASISAFSNTVDQTSAVPEPRFYGLIAGCLGAIVLIVKRRKSAV